MPNQIPLLFGQCVPRRMHGEASISGPHHHALSPTSSAFSAPWGHRAVVVQAFGGVGDDLVRVDAQNMAISFTRAARPHGAVEVEHVWRRLREHPAVAFKTVVEFEAGCRVLVRRLPQLTTATTFEKRRLDAVGHPTWIFLGRGGREAIDNEPKYVCRLRLFESHGTLVRPNTRVSLLLQHPQLVSGTAVRSRLNGGHQNRSRRFRLHNGIHNV